MKHLSLIAVLALASLASVQAAYLETGVTDSKGRPVVTSKGALTTQEKKQTACNACPHQEKEKHHECCGSCHS